MLLLLLLLCMTVYIGAYPALFMVAQPQPVQVDQMCGASAAAEVITYGVKVTAGHLRTNLQQEGPGQDVRV
jgi:hypothetical protein